MDWVLNSYDRSTDRDGQSRFTTIAAGRTCFAMSRGGLTPRCCQMGRSSRSPTALRPLDEV
jgi:hypothetical protein